MGRAQLGKAEHESSPIECDPSPALAGEGGAKRRMRAVVISTPPPPPPPPPPQCGGRGGGEPVEGARRNLHAPHPNPLPQERERGRQTSILPFSSMTAPIST